MCAKFGCGPTVVSKKGGGYRQTDRQRKLQLYIVEDTTVKHITYLQRTDIATPKLWNPSVGVPSKTTKSDTKTSCKNINRQ